MINRGTPVAVTVKSDNVGGRSNRSAAAESPIRGSRDVSIRQTSGGGRSTYEKMSHRIQEFEDDCRRWREKFFNESKLGRPSSAMLREQPRLQLGNTDFPEFPSWGTSSDGSGGGSRRQYFDSPSHGPSDIQSADVGSPYESFIEEDLNGRKILKLKFDIGDYLADEIKVSVDNYTLFIKGNRDIAQGNTTKSENFSKELTIPDFADKNDIRSSLTSDGFLIVQCPVMENRLKTSNNIRGFLSHPFSSQTRSRTESHSGYNTSASSVTRTNQPQTSRTTNEPISGRTYRTSSPHTWSQERSQSGIERNTGQKVPVHWPAARESVATNDMLVYKFDFPDFRIEDLNIQVKDKTVLINAQKEDFNSDGKTTRKYQREINVPANADPSQLRNGFSNDGVLTIEIPCLRRSGDNQRQSDGSSHQSQIRTTVASTDELIDGHGRPAQTAHSNVNIRKDSRYAATAANSQNSLKLRYDLSAYRTDNIQVQVTGNVLSIHAPRLSRPTRNASEAEDYSQRYTLPDWADGTNARANVDKDGILTVDIPRRR